MYVSGDCALFCLGRDLCGGREGGMWLGVATKTTSTRQRVRIGALLNVTGAERKDGVHGRGFVVADYLQGDFCLMDYVAVLAGKGPHNAFNLVAVEIRCENAFFPFTLTFTKCHLVIYHSIKT